MVDLKADIEYCKKFKTSNVAFTSSIQNIADALTKVKGESILKETRHNTQLSNPLQRLDNKKHN